MIHPSALIDPSAELDPTVSVGPFTVIGPRVHLADSVVVHSGTRIWPEVTVATGTVVKEHVLNSEYDLGYEGS